MEQQERWPRWNRLILQGNNNQVVQEFDELIRQKKTITFGDLVLRDQALEEMGVLSLSPNAMFNRKVKNERTRTRK